MEGCTHIAVEDVALAYASVNLASLSNSSSNNMVALILCHLYHQVCDLEEVHKRLA